MPSSNVVFRFLAEPTDVNFGGKVHGGVVMKWIDQAGYACAAGWSGQIVEVEAKIAHTGSTSMQIFIQVRCGDPKTQNMVETNHCVISFVAMDETGYPVEVPAFKAQTEEDIKLENYAIKMKQIAIETENLLHKV